MTWLPQQDGEPMKCPRCDAEVPRVHGIAHRCEQFFIYRQNPDEITPAESLGEKMDAIDEILGRYDD